MSSEVERLEAEVRRLMAAHARIQDRGFDTWRQRAEIHERIDLYLDEYAKHVTPAVYVVPLPEVPC